MRKTFATAAVVSILFIASVPATAGVIGNDNGAFTSQSLSMEIEESNSWTGFAFAISPRLGQLLLRIGLVR